MRLLYVFGSEESRRAWLMRGHIAPHCDIEERQGAVYGNTGGQLHTVVVGDRDSMRALQGTHYDVVLLHPSFYPILQAQRDLGWDEFVRLCLLR